MVNAVVGVVDRIEENGAKGAHWAICVCSAVLNNLVKAKLYGNDKARIDIQNG